MEERLNQIHSKMKLARLDQVGILSRLEGLTVEVKNISGTEEELEKLLADIDNLLARLASNKKLMLELVKELTEIKKEFDEQYGDDE